MSFRPSSFVPSGNQRQSGNVADARQPKGPGVRAGLGGLGSILSSGCNDLDTLCGGGLPLGCVIVLIEAVVHGDLLVLLSRDDWGKLAHTLLQYFIAEGLACKQRLLHVHPTGDSSRLMQQLPCLVVKNETSASKESADVKGPEQELRIAWQYKRYIKTTTSGPSERVGPRVTSAVPTAKHLPPWAHRFDLSKPIECPPLDEDCCRVSARGRTFGTAIQEAGPPFVRSVLAASSAPSGMSPSVSAEAAIPTFSPKSVGRIAVLELGNPLSCRSDAFDAAVDAVQSVLALKALVHETRCVAMVTLHAAAAANAVTVQQIQHLAHIVLHVQSVRDDAELVKLSTEPHSCCALMRVDKVSVPGHIRLPVTEPMLLMVRHRRTRLAITPVEIDPDAEMAVADAEARLTGRSALSLLCAKPSADEIAF